MKLTSTNRPFGLIIKLSQTVFWERANKERYAFVRTVSSASSRTCNASQSLLSRSRAMGRPVQTDRPETRELQVSGDQTARVTPVPIPNTVVKPRRADDTARATVWERRSSPGLNWKRPLRAIEAAFFVFERVRSPISDRTAGPGFITRSLLRRIGRVCFG